MFGLVLKIHYRWTPDVLTLEMGSVGSKIINHGLFSLPFKFLGSPISARNQPVLICTNGCSEQLLFSVYITWDIWLALAWHQIKHKLLSRIVYHTYSMHFAFSPLHTRELDWKFSCSSQIIDFYFICPKCWVSWKRYSWNQFFMYI